MALKHHLLNACKVKTNLNNMANTLFLILSIVLVFLFGMVNTRLGNLDLLASLNDIDSGLQCNILEIRVSNIM